MKRLTSLTLLLVLCASCSSKTAPSAPAAPPASGLALTWPFIYVSLTDDGTQYGTAQIADANGPVTNAAVTLSYNGGSQGMTFYSAGNYMPVTVQGAYVVDVLAANYDSGPLSYIPGQPCTVTAAFDGKTYTGSVTTVGSVTFAPGAADMVVSWAGGGNADQVLAVAEVSMQPPPIAFGPPAVSPVTIQNSVLVPAYTPGLFGIDAILQNTSPFPGIGNGSNMSCFANFSTNY